MPTHITTQNSIMTRGTIKSNQLQWNESHIETSFSTMQDEMGE